MNIGLPKIDLVFKSLAVSAIERSKKGIVCLIIKDDTDKTFEFAEYKAIDEIETSKYTATNVQYIKDCFAGNPSKIIVARMDIVGTLAEFLPKIKTKYFNWIGLAEGATQEQQDLVTWVKNTNQNDKKVYKAIVYKATLTDNMQIVNFKNDTVKPIGKEAIAGEKYISRLLGIFAGLPFTESATYYVLNDLEDVSVFTDLETQVNEGGLCLFNDEGKVRIARAVNSLQTVSQGLSDDMKKITIVEAMNQIQTDVSDTFKNYYLRKYKNVYDNQVLFISAINSYFRQLANDSVLDTNFKNEAFVNVEKQRLAWIGTGKTEAENWSELEVKLNTFRSNLFLGGRVKILDAMEDLDFIINM